ncbi:MAG: accessory Sec system protein translocase subunit SecY2 [Roseburia sp.]|nr:accessory Sec system protein translocase subunit SecY2 [Roseburia sp.]
MERSKNTNSIVKYKFIYTILILGVYLVGRGLPLYMIDVSAYLQKVIDVEALLVQTISGDIYQCSLFALGISPFMISSMITQVLIACRSSESRAKISQAKMNRISLKITLIIAVAQAVVKVQELHFRIDGDMLLLAKTVAAIEMVAGAMVILWLAERNKRYGIGGQSALILVNLLDGLRITLQGHDMRELTIPLSISLAVMLIMLVMENTEKRIPLQRISIHNIYADKNYLAIKLNPIGVMPAMFSMAFFMLPQLVITLLTWIFPGNAQILWWQSNMTLTKPVGITVYIVTLYVLTLGFSRIFVNPKEITEQFLKSGDSIQDIHAGKDTKRYLSRTITRLGVLSATVMSVCLGAPMVLQLTGDMTSSFTTLPSTMMMLTGIWCNLYSEVRALRDLEAYKPFI